MISIPVEALSTDAEDNSNVAPEIGDEVTLPEVKARVKKIEEGEAYVEILSVGGMPAEYENKDTEKTEMPEDEQSMRKMVEKYDGASHQERAELLKANAKIGDVWGVVSFFLLSSESYLKVLSDYSRHLTKGMQAQ